MQGNQNRSRGSIMRSNCCCDSQSTTTRVGCKKGSISSVARTRACSPPLLLLLLWNVTGFRVQRLEVEGWGDGVIVWKLCGSIHMKTGGLCPRIFPPWDPFSKSAFSGSVWTVGQNAQRRWPPLSDISVLTAEWSWRGKWTLLHECDLTERSKRTGVSGECWVESEVDLNSHTQTKTKHPAVKLASLLVNTHLKKNLPWQKCFILVQIDDRGAEERSVTPGATYRHIRASQHGRHIPVAAQMG